jgi:putative FmdB family regulatory protein
MPILEYRCTECGERYEILHLTREKVEENICPSCGSVKYTKLMSAPSIVTSHAGGGDCVPDNCPNPGGCCGGACAMGN